MNSCGNTKANITKVNTNQENKQDTVAQETHHTTAVRIPSKTDIDFYAHGKDGLWQLSLRFGGKIVFTSTKNNIAFQAMTNKKFVAQGANVVSIFAQTNDYVLKATIDVVKCTDKGNIVNVVVHKTGEKKGIDFEGCGTYMGDPELQHVWSVIKVNGETLNDSLFPKELPHFEFDLLQQKISGFAGCNQVHGDLSFDYNRITIKPLVSTRMYCGDASKVEAQIMEILNHQPFYTFRGGKLIIETTKGIMILKKVSNER